MFVWHIPALRFPSSFEVLSVSLVFHLQLEQLFRGLFPFGGQTANSHFDNLFSEFVISNYFPITVFRASEVHEANIVPLFPAAGGFFTDITVFIRDNVTSSQ